MAKTHTAVAILFIALAIAMTWPLVYGLDRFVAYPGDPYINTWILDWDWYATIHQPLTLFQTNVFYPAKYSLAFSEHLYGIALLLFPLRAAGVGPLTAHNIAMLGGFAFSGFAAYLLGRRISGSVAGGVAAGIFYAFAPWRFTQLPHVQHVWGGWLPMLLLALLYYAERPSWRRASLFGLAFLMNGLTNVHWFLFGSLVIVLSIPVVVRRKRELLPLAVTAVVAFALLLPFLVPYARAAELYGMKRSWEEVTRWSATASDWLNPGTMTRFYRRWADPSTDPERWLFPGALATVFGLAGAIVGFGRSGWRSEGRPPAPDRRPFTTTALVWVAVGFIGSLGTHTFFYRFLFSYAPGFRAVRVPARWAAISYVGLAMLIAIAAGALAAKRRWAGVLIAAMFVAELRAAPIRWWPASPEVPAVYRWLAQQGGPVVELPIDASEVEYSYMRFAAVHHRPIVNGVSGFVPPEYARLVALWQRDASGGDFVAELRRIGVEVIVLHGEFAKDREREWLRRELAAKRISYVGRFDHGPDGDWVFKLGAGLSSAPDLDAFLRGKYTYSASTFGVLDNPGPGEVVKGMGFFSGWALSPAGVRGVDLLFDNGLARYPATLIEDKGLKGGFPWYPLTPRPRFIASFPARPDNVRRDTDVQVEITDGNGKRTLLEGRWFQWGQ